jgi:Na+-transporting methylmalonyl-CoA/oxaloacetate decarboxylase gamma subunit
LLPKTYRMYGTRPCNSQSAATQITDFVYSGMTSNVAEPRRPILGMGVVLVVIALLILIAFGYCSSRLVTGNFLGRNGTTITNDVVVQQIRTVAKLVSSEATVRDVIVYENTWYGSTKRSLVVVTGRLLAGIDLRDNPEVAIDHAAKRIAIRIPRAKLLAVEITDMRTYDERGGLWNPFTREDRDAIQRQARTQLTAAGNQLELLRHANESAVQMLQLLLAKDGYTVDVTLR